MAAALKRENMERTAAQVRRIMVASSGDAPSERTLQRHFAREDLTTPRGTTVFGRFEAEAPNVLWTGDQLCRYRHNWSYADLRIMLRSRSIEHFYAAHSVVGVLMNAA
jgi:hypothetical protein